jgi:hypothetical protein
MARQSVDLWYTEYLHMVDAWRTIVATSLSDEEKQDACLSMLRNYIGHLALSCARKPNPTLRFWADMFLLKERLASGLRIRDELGRLAIEPAFRLVKSWVQSNAQGRVVEVRVRQSPTYETAHKSSGDP